MSRRTESESKCEKRETAASRRYKFILCIDRFDEPNGWIWSVRVGNKWLNATNVQVNVPMVTVFRGVQARQPKAFLTGVGVVRQTGSMIFITEK